MDARRTPKCILHLEEAVRRDQSARGRERGLAKLAKIVERRLCVLIGGWRHPQRGEVDRDDDVHESSCCGGTSLMKLTSPAPCTISRAKSDESRWSTCWSSGVAW